MEKLILHKVEKKKYAIEINGIRYDIKSSGGLFFIKLGISTFHIENRISKVKAFLLDIKSGNKTIKDGNLYDARIHKEV